jgi:hypothetical protein
MASVLSINESELLDALAASVCVTPDEARTAEELVEHTGLTLGKVRKALHLYAKEGRLQVHAKLKPGIDGRQISRPAYTILPAKKKR